MSFATPTIDVYVPGTTLGLGNVNASTINIGQPGTTVNVGGTMAVTNSVTTPSCTMSSLTTGNLIISPFSGNVAFNNFSAVNANISSASMINASFNSINSSNILIGPYPISGTYTNMNVTNATVSTLNVSNFLITPLSNNPTFTNITTNNLTASGTITANLFNSTSDIRFKDIIRNITIEETINFINNTNPILFKWKNNEKLGSGYSAQEVIKTSGHHLVEISDNIDVKETNDGPEGKQYHLNYDGIIPYHGVAIKHLLNENTQLKNDINKLSNIIDELYREIQILKK